MKKIFNFILITSVLIFGVKTYAMQNPWIDCKDDISCGAKKAGFNFPLKVKNYSVRAMDGLMEISFPLDKKRTVTARKAVVYSGNSNENGIGDISGDYNNYKVNKPIRLKNGVLFDVRGDKNKFYVVNFAAESGYYSFYCPSGMKMKDIEYFYNILQEAETPELSSGKKHKKDAEPVFTQDCFPRTLQKQGVTKECFEKANMGDNSACSASEFKLIKEYYRKGQDKDPLNDCSGRFCAED